MLMGGPTPGQLRIGVRHDCDAGVQGWGVAERDSYEQMAGCRYILIDFPGKSCQTSDCETVLQSIIRIIRGNLYDKVCRPKNLILVYLICSNVVLLELIRRKCNKLYLIRSNSF